MEIFAFDTLAATYDSDFTDMPVARVLRRMVWDRMDRLFARGERLLEIGCGTGEDASYLAAAGHRIVATDASASMLQVAQKKLASRGLADRVEFLNADMDALGHRWQPQSFDGAYSNFGAVNCCRNLTSLAQALALCLKPAAPLQWVVMGKHVPWEWAWYGLRGQFRKAFRRLPSRGTQWRNLHIIYPTPPHVARILQLHFEITNIVPLGFFLPPSYAANIINNRPRVLRGLIALEKRAQHRPTLARFADHYIVEARRR